MPNRQLMISYRIAKPDVASEDFEDDTIVINLKTGRYYTLEGSAKLLWAWLDQGCSVEAMQSAMTAEFQSTSPDCGEQVAVFVKELLSEQLIVEADNSDCAFQIPAEHRFVSPKLQVSCDLEELLSIDPIHDVDESGWPSRQAPVG